VENLGIFKQKPDGKESSNAAHAKTSPQDVTEEDTFGPHSYQQPLGVIASNQNPNPARVRNNDVLVNNQLHTPQQSCKSFMELKNSYCLGTSQPSQRQNITE
jgi:hypothetical protein